MFGLPLLGMALGKLRGLAGAKAAEKIAEVRRLPLERQLELCADDQRVLLRAIMEGELATGSRVAHHIIPLEALKKYPELMRKAARGGFDINGINNGFAILKQLHPENHPWYNERAMNALREIVEDSRYAQMNDAEIAAKIQGLADHARDWLSKQTTPLP